jgi:ABC-type multidrug transport system fused ATPase/permease subunit
MIETSDLTPPLHRLVSMLWRITTLPMRLQFLTLFLVMLVAAIAELGSLLGIQVYFKFIASRELSLDNPITSLLAGLDARTQIIALSIGLGGLLLIKLALDLLTNLMLARTVVRQQVTLATRLFKAYQFAPYTWYGGRNTSDLQRNLLLDVNLVSNQITLQLLQLVLNSIISGALLVFILLTLSPGLMLAIGAIVVLLATVAMRVQKILIKAGSQTRLASGETLKATDEGMNSMTEARILGRNDNFIRRFQRTQSRLGYALRRRIFLTQSLPLVLESLIMISFIMIVSFMVVTGDGVEDAFAMAAVLAVAIFRLRQVLNKILGAINKIGSASASLPPLVQDLETLEPLSEQAPRRVAAPEPGFSVLQFDNAKFHFPDQDNLALAGISTTLRRGEHLAIMGATGAGKSTFLLMLLGLIRPTEGQIILDGTPLSQVLAEWNAQIGYVPQAVFLIDDTIAANVAFGVPEEERDPERIRIALEQAQLLDFVSGLPQDINSPVGERGSALSGGQRQRIGLARALYRTPTVIILDEATSALDLNTQTKMLQALSDLPQNPTVISVTHQLEPLEYADRLILLEEGRISADGSVKEVWRSEAFHRITTSGGVEEGT